MMTQAVTAGPVPIRLAYRYPNGSMISYSARATAHDDSTLRVMVNEAFEPGISLAVMAPFLRGLTNARVTSVIRSKKQPGYYEVILALAAEANSAAGLSSEGPGNSVMNERQPGLPEPSSKRWSLARVPEELADVAKQLGDMLEVVPPRRISEVMEGIAPELRGTATVIAAAAVLHLLEQKGVVPAWQLVRGARKRMKK
jgi:hypothetical protein